MRTKCVKLPVQSAMAGPADYIMPGLKDKSTLCRKMSSETPKEIPLEIEVHRRRSFTALRVRVRTTTANHTLHGGLADLHYEPPSRPAGDYRQGLRRQRTRPHEHGKRGPLNRSHHRLRHENHRCTADRPEDVHRTQSRGSARPEGHDDGHTEAVRPRKSLRQ